MKQGYRKKGKNNGGITLIALAVTILVLIILASISIKALTGDNGIIGQSKNAKDSAEIDSEKELVKQAAVQAIGKNRYSNLTEEGLANEIKNEATVERIRKKLVVTFNESRRSYYVDEDENVFEYVYSNLPVMALDIFRDKIEEYKDEIKSVQVLDNMNIPENAYQVFDVSKAQNETVKAWLVENAEDTGIYDLYIGGNDGVEIWDCSRMFEDFTKCTKIDIENLYTEKVEDFSYMFLWDSRLVELKCKSELVTSKAKSLEYMFYCCTQLKSIDTSNWDTINVTNMFGTFRMCQNISEIDLKNWDTKRVTQVDYLFQYCGNLRTIYVSDKWNMDNVTSSYCMFQGCNSLKGAISFDSGKQGHEYANYENGYFTYKE